MSNNKRRIRSALSNARKNARKIKKKGAVPYKPSPPAPCVSSSRASRLHSASCYVENAVAQANHSIPQELKIHRDSLDFSNSRSVVNPVCPGSIRTALYNPTQETVVVDESTVFPCDEVLRSRTGFQAWIDRCIAAAYLPTLLHQDNPDYFVRSIGQYFSMDEKSIVCTVVTELCPMVLSDWIKAALTHFQKEALPVSCFTYAVILTTIFL